MKIFKKVVSYLSILCYVVIIALVLILAPMVVGYKPVVVLSGSMEPTYPVGSLIYYKAASFEDIKENDAIPFRVDDDTNPVEYQNVAGKTLEFCLPVVGTIFASSAKYIAVAIIGGILLLNIVLSNLVADEKEKVTV